MQEIIQDPTGFEVILTDKCWTDHILRRHPELGPFRKLVVETVKKPDGIYQGKRDPSNRIYPRKYPEVPGVGNWLDLLVFVRDDTKYVATAYFAAAAFRALGERIWPSK